MQYWKKIALESNEHERKQLADLAPLRVILARKAAVKNDVKDDHETFSDYLKTFSKSIKEVENMSLKNKVLLGGWISKAVKVWRKYVWKKYVWRKYLWRK